MYKQYNSYNSYNSYKQHKKITAARSHGNNIKNI